MKKIKISEQQAKMLKDLGKTKVLKITQEQYSRIVELEKLNEGAPEIELAFRQKLSNAARKDFNKMEEGQSGKINEIYEMYESFISELYGVNENTEKKHGKLIKLMELAGLVNNNRLVKEKFNNDKNLVEYVMCEALYEMHNGCSEYKVMEMIEEMLHENEYQEHKPGETIDMFKDYQGKPERVEVGKEADKVRLEKWLNNNKYNDNYLYFQNQYDKGEYQKALLDITRLKKENKDSYPKDEATMAGSAGGYVGKIGDNPMHKTNVVIINDEKVETGTNNTMINKVMELSEIISYNSEPNSKFIQDLHKLKGEILNELENNPEGNQGCKKIPKMINTLTKLANEANTSGITDEYTNFLGLCQEYLNEDFLSTLKYEEEILEQSVQNSGQYDVNSFVNPEMTGDTLRGEGPTWKKPTIPGGTEVKIPEKCSTFPYCNQGVKTT